MLAQKPHGYSLENILGQIKISVLVVTITDGDVQLPVTNNNNSSGCHKYSEDGNFNGFHYNHYLLLFEDVHWLILVLLVLRPIIL